MTIVGVSHPIPTKYAERIYDEGKTVFVGIAHLGKVSSGDKFIIYESRGAKAYTGMGKIKFIGKMKPKQIIREYKEALMITEEELKKYSVNRDEMNVIEFENFQKFSNPVKPDKYVSLSGKYIREDEYNMIMKNQG